MQTINYNKSWKAFDLYLYLFDDFKSCHKLQLPIHMYESRGLNIWPAACLFFCRLSKRKDKLKAAVDWHIVQLLLRVYWCVWLCITSMRTFKIVDILILQYCTSFFSGYQWRESDFTTTDISLLLWYMHSFCVRNTVYI